MTRIFILIVKKRKTERKFCRLASGKKKKMGAKNAQMDQSLKESEPFLPCGWNVLVRAAVQMENAAEAVSVRGWQGDVGKGSIHTV